MIYLIRHAETEWNFQLRKQGLDDSPLTDRGRDQAEGYSVLIRDLISKADVDNDKVRLFHSPLGRTRATAQYLVDTLALPDNNIFVEPRLIEFDYGDWSGLTNSEIEQQYPGALANREVDKWHYTVPGGESYADVARKAVDWLGGLDDNMINIAVTHSVVSRVIRGCYLDMDKDEAGRLEHRQDAFFVLRDGAVEELEIA